MRKKAEIFDLMQFLFGVTGYNDHQIRCVVYFDGRADERILEKSAKLLVRTVPVLSRRYVNRREASYWEDCEPSEMKSLFTVTDSGKDFDTFTCSATDEKAGPQIRFCLYRGDNDALSIVINHMVSDAAGFKQCVYLFADIYSKLINDPDYTPEKIVDGDRSFREIAKKLTFPRRIKLLVSGLGNSNSESDCGFQISCNADIAPFIVSHELPTELYGKLREVCAREKVTVNDVLLTAYFRTLNRYQNMKGRELDVAIMIDMRRWLDDRSFLALTNLTSTTILRTAVPEGESFHETLIRINAMMEKRKASHLGMDTLMKLYEGYRIPFADHYGISERVLRHPKLGMTNIGVIDHEKLVFEGTPVKNAVMYASVKYRPYFQLSVTSFRNRMTLASSLYGSAEDRAAFEDFYTRLDRELGEIQARLGCYTH